MSLKNLLNRLIREGKLKRQETDIAYVQNLLDAAKRNFAAASLIEGKIDEVNWGRATAINLISTS